MKEISNKENEKFHLIGLNVSYSKYINILYKWKILRTSDIVGLIEDISIPSIKRHLKEMREAGIIESRRMNGFTKEFVHILTKRFSSENEIYLPATSVLHELSINIFIINILKKYNDYIASIELSHENKLASKKDSNEPDGEIEFRSINGKIIRVAIELELNQKCENRFLKKIITYDKDDEYDFVFYVFGGNKIFNSYWKISERRPELLKSFPKKVLFLNFHDYVSMDEGCMNARVRNPHFESTFNDLIEEWTKWKQ